MSLRTSRLFSALLAISVAMVTLILSWGRLSKDVSPSWTPDKPEDGLFGGNQKGNPTRLSITSRQKPSLDASSEGNATGKLRPDPTTASARAAVAETPVPVLSIKSFASLPQWDFEDVYNLDAPPRHTTCVRTLRNDDDGGFKEAFLPSVCLFLHKDNINMSEWNRLSHFNNPFGFMGYRYDDVMASVKLIPKPSEPLLPPKPGSDGCVRCAVVGTAGILSGSKMGKEIDAHDHVFRMNAAVVNGYEEDVGRRTSVYVHTAHSITASLKLLQKHGHATVPNDEAIKYVMIPEGMRDFYWLEGLLKGGQVTAGLFHNKWPRMYYGGQYNESRFYVLHQDFLRYVRNRFLKSAHLNSTHWALFRPTNGAFTVFLALHTCDIVSAYGFMTEDYKKYSNYYFQEEKTQVVFYINHDYDLEKNLWKKLHDSKIIKLYQRLDPETETGP